MDLSKPLSSGVHAEVFPWQEGKVVKLAKASGRAAWVEYEFRLSKLVHATGLSVPEPFELVEVEGRRGIVYTRVDGKSMWSCVRTAPHKLLSFARMLGRLHAEMHAHLAPPGVLDLHDVLRNDIETAQHVPPDVRQSIVEKLDALPRGDRLLHGDFHPGNIVMSGAGPVIIDWFGAARGDPLADVALTSFLLDRRGPPRNPVLYLFLRIFHRAFHRAYLNAYFEKSPCRREGIEAWLVPLGLIATARRRTRRTRGLAPPLTESKEYGKEKIP